MTKQKVKRSMSTIKEDSSVDKDHVQRRRSDSLNSMVDLAPKIQIDDDCSIATDLSLQELKFKDVVDFYQMLDDQTSPDNVRRQQPTTDHQNERFDILIQGFKTVTMEYVDNDVAKDGCEHSESSGDEHFERPPKPKNITD